MKQLKVLIRAVIKCNTQHLLLCGTDRCQLLVHSLLTALVVVGCLSYELFMWLPYNLVFHLQYNHTFPVCGFYLQEPKLYSSTNQLIREA